MAHVWTFTELEQVTVLLSTTLTATLAVAREQRVASMKRDKAASDEKVYCTLPYCTAPYHSTFFFSCPVLNVVSGWLLRRLFFLYAGYKIGVSF